MDKVYYDTLGRPFKVGSHIAYGSGRGGLKVGIIKSIYAEEKEIKHPSRKPFIHTLFKIGVHSYSIFKDEVKVNSISYLSGIDHCIILDQDIPDIVKDRFNG